MAILILFFFSGATALVYEVIWSKYLSLLFGSTIQAQTVVLAVFMGGLALGNKLFSRSADRARNPLGIYGLIETAIGVYAVLFPLLYRLADGIFASAGSHLLDHPGPLLLLKGGLSVALLLGPTILMGGTLPVLAAWLQKKTTDAGRRSARFYSTNSLGAVCGAGLTGFFLVPWLGLKVTMEVSALINVIIGLTAMALGRRPGSQVPVVAPVSAASPPSLEQRHANSSVFRWGCLIVALTGAVSMGLEVLASRCLCLIFGASLQVFAIVLMAFILGIGLGSAVIASRGRNRMRRETTTIFLLLGAALLIGFLVFNIENLVAVYLQAQSGLGRTPVGYRFYQVLTSIVSIAVLGLPAAALGSVLPLWIRAVSETSDLLGDRVGRLLTWNTLGAVAGVLLTGFVLMPQIGLRGAFTSLAGVLVVAAVGIALSLRRTFATIAGIAAGVFLIIASTHGDENWRYVFSAGVFREYGPDYSMGPVLARKKAVKLEFYEDAADATVSVERELKGNEELVLRIDGKIDATSKFDMSTQLLLAQLPLMVRPESKDVFCFGMGSGVTAGATLEYPIEHLTVAENCEPVLRAVHLFEPWNHGVYTNSRARIYHEDARTVLKLRPEKYDVIISEPSNPWMVGVASVFTDEFYRLAASRLKPGGIMTQWFHTYEMDDRTVDMVLRTFGNAFPNMEIWDVDDGDIVLLGSDQPWNSGTETLRHAFDLEGPRNHLDSIGLETAGALMARRLASQRTAFAIAGPGPIQRDDFPLLEYEAPRAFYIYLQTRGVFRLQNFDERTWQMDLASDDQNSALGQLDLPALKSIFGSGHPSMNADLEAYLHQCYSGNTKPLIIANRAMPSSLESSNRGIMIYSPPSAATNALTHQLAMSEYVLRKFPERASEAIAGIKNALDATPYYVKEGADWSPSFYADLGVKASLRVGDAANARSILLRGLQLEPDSDELGYLARVMVRNGMLPASEVPATPVR